MAGVVVQRRTGRELRCEMSVLVQISLRPIISWSVATGQWRIGGELIL